MQLLFQDIAPNYYDLANFEDARARQALVRVAEKIKRKEATRGPLGGGGSKAPKY